MELILSGLSTLIVGLMVAGIVFLAVRSIVKDKKMENPSAEETAAGAAVPVCAIPGRKSRRNKVK